MLGFLCWISSSFRYTSIQILFSRLDYPQTFLSHRVSVPHTLISTMEEDKQDKRKDGDDLEDLLTEAAQRTAIRAAMKRKAVEEALLKPSMLKMLEELVTDLAKEQPEDTSEEVDKVRRVKGS